MKKNDKDGSVMLAIPFKKLTFFNFASFHFLWGFDSHYIVNLLLIIGVAQCLA